MSIIVIRAFSAIRAIFFDFLIFGCFDRLCFPPYKSARSVKKVSRNLENSRTSAENYFLERLSRRLVETFLEVSGREDSCERSLGSQFLLLPENRAALKGTNLRGRTPICSFLRVPAVFCGFLRKSAVSCENLRFPNASFSRKRRESAKICENLQKSAFGLGLSF